MYLKINEDKMYYEITGSGIPVIFMHGWEKNHLEFKSVIEKLKNIKAINIDFMNFGESDKSSNPLTLDDYVEHIKLLIDYLKIDNPILVGHSFGGRVAIRYARKYNCSKIILVNSAGIRPKRTLKYYYKIYKYKLLKKYYSYFSKEKYDIIIKSGSDEYQKLDEVERRTFSNIVNFNLRKSMKKIKAKTLILAGCKDKTIPFNDQIIINKLIENSKLIPFYRSGHFCYIDEEKKFIDIINDFIGE